MEKINFSSDKEEIVCVAFENCYGVEIYPNFEAYVQQDIQRQNHIYRYDLAIIGFSEKEDAWYNLFGLNMIDPDRLYNLSQEQVEDICEEISLLPPYVLYSDVADHHERMDDTDDIDDRDEIDDMEDDLLCALLYAVDPMEIERIRQLLEMKKRSMRSAEMDIDI